MTYTLVPVLIAAIVVILTMYMVGYRFNAEEQTLTQGGLLQFDSYPGGASVAVNGSTLSSRTSTRLDIEVGSHSVTMSRDGYHPWQKTATVEPGKILWLNYARLVPEKITPEHLYDYPKFQHATANIEESRLAIVTDATLPRIELVRADNGSAPQTYIDLPTASFTAANEGQAHNFRIASWDRAGRFLLVKHSVGDTEEWLAVDTNNPDQTKNISRIVERPISAVMFDETDSRRIYVISDDTLRRVDSGNSTLSAPLARHVTSMRQSEKGVVTLVTNDPETAKRTVSYYTPGASKQKILREYTDETSHIDGQIIEYARQQYSAVLRGATLEIHKLALHPSDSTDAVNPQVVARMNLPDGADTIEFSPNGRFVMAQKGVSLVVYDLELDQQYSFNVRSQSADEPTTVRWFDDYHIYTTTGGELRWYEFDGANSRAIIDAVSSSDIVLSQDGRYVYVVQTTPAGVHQLVRLRFGA